MTGVVMIDWVGSLPLTDICFWYSSSVCSRMGFEMAMPASVSSGLDCYLVTLPREGSSSTGVGDKDIDFPKVLNYGAHRPLDSLGVGHCRATWSTSFPARSDPERILHTVDLVGSSLDTMRLGQFISPLDGRIVPGKKRVSASGILPPGEI